MSVISFPLSPAAVSLFQSMMCDEMYGCEFKRAIKAKKSPTRSKRFFGANFKAWRTKIYYGHIKKIVANKIKYLISFLDNNVFLFPPVTQPNTSLTFHLFLCFNKFAISFFALESENDDAIHLISVWKQKRNPNAIKEQTKDFNMFFFLHSYIDCMPIFVFMWKIIKKKLCRFHSQ